VRGRMLDGSTSTKDASFEQALCRKARRRGSIPRAAEQSATLVRTCRSHIGGPGMFLEVARSDECRQDYINAAGSNPGPCSHECVLRKQAKRNKSCFPIVVEVSQDANIAGGCEQEDCTLVLRESERMQTGLHGTITGSTPIIRVGKLCLPARRECLVIFVACSRAA
jgi:hypothetical protein